MVWLAAIEILPLHQGATIVTATATIATRVLPRVRPVVIDLSIPVEDKFNYTDLKGSKSAR